MALLQLTERSILDYILGNCIGCVRTAIAAAATAQTAINTGSVATGGVSGNMDTTPSANDVVFIATPGSGATQNQYTNPAAFQVSSSTATVMTIPSQSIGPARSIGDYIFKIGNTGSLSMLGGCGLLNTVYVGLTTQLTSGATSANILSGEPTSTGSYARVAYLNSPTNFSAATGSQPATKTTLTAVTFAASSAAWSTGSTTLKAWFIADASTLAGGNVLCIGDLTTPQAVNAAGITPSFALGQLSATLQ
jgi:hypothetical protein